jgi:hypothetical protein
MKGEVLIPAEIIEKRIFLIRKEKVMLDIDLALLYGIETKLLKRAVRRNADRFPGDFMFELNREEYYSLRSQFGTLKRGEHSKYLPYAFTEQGVAMLSSVLRSKQAVRVNIQIMRAFVKLRELMSTHKDLVIKLRELENKYEKHDAQIKSIFDAIRQLMLPPKKSVKKIGFDIK